MEYEIEISPAEMVKIGLNEELLVEMTDIVPKFYWELYRVAKKYDCYPYALMLIFTKIFSEAAKQLETERLLEEGEKNV